MFDAQLLFPGAAGAALSVYSPWFPRQGDNLRVTVDVVQRASSKLTISVWTKNTTDTDDGGDAHASTSIVATATGRAVAEWVSGTATLKELCRYKFTVQSTGSSATDWCLFRMLAPVWFDTVKV